MNYKFLCPFTRFGGGLIGLKAVYNVTELRKTGENGFEQLHHEFFNFFKKITQGQFEKQNVNERRKVLIRSLHSRMANPICIG